MLKTLGLMLMIWPMISSAQTTRDGNPPVQSVGIWIEEEILAEFRAKKGPGACAGLILVTDSKTGSKEVFTNMYGVDEYGNAAFSNPQIQGLSALGKMNEQGLITVNAEVLKQAEADYLALFPPGNTLTDMKMTLQFQTAEGSHVALVNAVISLSLNGTSHTIKPEPKTLVPADDVFYGQYTEAISRCTNSLK